MPFGQIATEALPDLTAAPESIGFIGERYDSDAGLQFLNARYYDPELGLFLQPDWFEVTKAGVGTNRYAYSGNDPVNRLDPGGNDWEAFKEWFSRPFNGLARRAREDVAERERNDPELAAANEQWRNAHPELASAFDFANQIEAMGQTPQTFEDLAAGVAAGDPAAVAQAFVTLSPWGRRIAREGTPPPNMAPVGANRNAAFREAKRGAGIPVSSQPTRTLPNVDRRGVEQPGVVYEFEVPRPGGGVDRIRIRDDSRGHYYGPNDIQNRGPHFNIEHERLGESDWHFDYRP